MKNILLSLGCTLLMLAGSAMAEPLRKQSCREIIGKGFDNMPEVVDYILAKKGGDKLGFASECHFGFLVFAQCWIDLESGPTADDAINHLIATATAHRKLPPVPHCGA
jgi:hypothetical protein